MLNALPTDKTYMLLIAHNSDYECKCILEYLQHVKPIVKSNRFFFTDNGYLFVTQFINKKLKQWLRIVMN